MVDYNPPYDLGYVISPVGWTVIHRQLAVNLFGMVDYNPPYDEIFSRGFSLML